MKKDKPTQPPQLFLRFFRWFCHPELKNYIEGDLMELYDDRLKGSGKTRADLGFIVDVLLLFRPGIIRPAQKHQNSNNYAMFKSYFKIGLRNLLKNKGYSLINIGGLALGMAAAILIGLWIYDELSYNKYHEHYDRLVKVRQHITVDGVTRTGQAVPLPLENVLRNTYGSDFTYMSLSSWTNEHILSSGENKITRNGNYVQWGFPEMLSLRMIQGTRSGMKDPSSILLSASAAKALFGEADPMNQSVRIDNRMDAKVMGIYEDLPHNSTFREVAFMANWELYASSEAWIKRAAEQWGNYSFQLYAQLTPGADIHRVTEKLKNVMYEHAQNERPFKPEIFLSPMQDWHLRSEWKNGINTAGRIQTVWLFGVIGIFVLLLACINFMNLSTARSEKRSKEVGIRMTIGSVRSQLINQFLSESFLVVLLAFAVGLACAVASLSWFNELADKRIAINWADPELWLIALSFILVTSLLAGSYPALYLSSFQPVKVLKGTFKAGRLSTLPRKVLVVVQFSVSVILVIGTIVVYQQIQFSKNRPVGYNREGLIMVQMRSPDFYGKHDVLSAELKSTGAIEEMAESSSPLTGIWQNSGGFSWEGKDPDLQSTDFGTIFITPEYGKTVNWKIKEGRDFSRDYATDSSAVIVNEAAVNFMGIKDPLGMEITWGKNKYHVIGVINDMIMDSPYKPVRQNIYFLSYDNVNWISIRLNPGRSTSESIASIGAVFRKHIPSSPFDYEFTDQVYAKKFDAEERIGKLAYVFAVLAIFISCLGLFGLSSFVAEQRTKEIGIRKVMGASVINLWRMLSKDFVLLAIIACVVAVPVSFYFMNNWLLQYQYHTTISWAVFAASVSGALIITLITVSYQAVRAAIANPVKSLRSE